MKLFPVLISLVSLSIGMSCTKDVCQNPDLLPKPIGGCDTITFAKHIQPIFINKCASCHQPGGTFPDLSTYTLIKTQVDGGRIKARVIDQTPSVMPRVGSAQLTTTELALIKCWLEKGSPNN